jgi:hypothetical protein
LFGLFGAFFSLLYRLPMSMALLGIAVGFYFGAKTAEKEEDKPPGLNDAGKATAPPGQNPEETTEE